MPVVTGTRKETSADRTHRHIVGVCLADGSYHSRAEVLTGLERGEAWTTRMGASTGRITKIAFCPRSGCYLGPYMTTAPDATARNHLDNLPPC
jgi:Protein of unknown function (DUF3892)